MTSGASLRSLLVIVLAIGPVRGAETLVSTPAELQAAAARAAPGDALVMKSGLWSDAEIVFSGQGTADKPITLQAEKPGQVVVAGQSRLRIAGDHLVVEGLLFERAWHKTALIEFRRDSRTQANNCRVTACAIVDCNPPDEAVESKWVSLYGRGNRFDHCYLAGKENLGTTLVVWLDRENKAPPAGHRIDHNHFGPRPPQKKNGGETIRIGDSQTSLQSAGCVVEANLFEECNGEVEIVSNKSCDNLYRGNTYLRCAGAVTLRHGNRCTVEGNFFLGQNARRTGGVRVIGEDHRVVNNYFSQLTGEGSRAALSMMNGIPHTPLHGYAQVRRALVAFNTFVDCQHHFALGLGESSATLAPQDCTFANNLAATSVAKSPIVQLVTAGKGWTWQGNLFFGAEIGLRERGGIAVLDPRLREAKDGLQRPAPGSPAIGAAEGDFRWLRSDIDGQPRQVPYDVGCDQASSAPILSRPLAVGDVGPPWRR